MASRQLAFRRSWSCSPRHIPGCLTPTDPGAWQVVLFTDLANAVSNAIYPRLGYRPVHDAVEIAFAAHTHGHGVHA